MKSAISTFLSKKAEKGRKIKKIEAKLSKKTCLNLHPNAGQRFLEFVAMLVIGGTNT